MEESNLLNRFLAFKNIVNLVNEYKSSHLKFSWKFIRKLNSWKFIRKFKRDFKIGLIIATWYDNRP